MALVREVAHAHGGGCGCAVTPGGCTEFELSPAGPGVTAGTLYPSHPLSWSAARDQPEPGRTLKANHGQAGTDDQESTSTQAHDGPGAGPPPTPPGAGPGPARWFGGSAGSETDFFPPRPGRHRYGGGGRAASPSAPRRGARRTRCRPAPRRSPLAQLGPRPAHIAGPVRGHPLILNFFASWCEPCQRATT